MSVPRAAAPLRAASSAPEPAHRLLLRRHGGGEFRRLLASRFAAQWGDGVFQAALGGALLFNPQRATDPLTIAAIVAVLLLPYSLVGPFAGALLDRWDRRRVLVVANLLRAVLIVAVAAAVGAGLGTAPLLAGVLLVTGVSRFVLAGLSTALPHVVHRWQLVGANALSVTLGSAVAVIGVGCAIVARALIGVDNAASAMVMAIAVPGSLVAAAIAARFARYRLGPDDEEAAETMVAVARGLVDALRAVARVRPVAAGFVALGAHRLGFGAMLLVVVLLYKYTFSSDGLLLGGLAGLGQVAAAGALGLLLAALATGPLTRRFGRRTTVRGALALAAVVTVAFGMPMLKSTTLALAFGLALAGQVVKLSVDATVQRDIGDDVRGRVFSLYDALFNTAYVLAITLAALAVPADGQAGGLLLGTAVVYVVAAAAHGVLDRPARA